MLSKGDLVKVYDNVRNRYEPSIGVYIDTYLDDNLEIEYVRVLIEGRIWNYDQPYWVVKALDKVSDCDE